MLKGSTRRQRGRRIASGKRFKPHEDAIIEYHVAIGDKTPQFVHLLPGRTIGSINGRVTKLGITRPDRGVRWADLVHRNIYLDPTVDKAMTALAKVDGVKWCEWVEGAIIDKITQATESHCGDETNRQS